MISLFQEGFYFPETSHLRSFAKIKPSLIFPNLQFAFDLGHILCPFFTNISLRKRDTDRADCFVLLWPLAINQEQ